LVGLPEWPLTRTDAIQQLLGPQDALVTTGRSPRCSPSLTWPPRVERTDARLGGLARDCAAAIGQVTGLHRTLGTLTGRADQIENRLAEVSGLLGRMSAQITALTEQPAASESDSAGYRVNPARRR
jgi:hypothetical protein